MWITGSAGDDNHDGFVSEDESGWDDIPALRQVCGIDGAGDFVCSTVRHAKNVTFADLAPQDGEDVYDREEVVNLTDIPRHRHHARMRDGGWIRRHHPPSPIGASGPTTATHGSLTRIARISSLTTPRTGAQTHTTDIDQGIGASVPVPEPIAC